MALREMCDVPPEKSSTCGTRSSPAYVRALTETFARSETWRCVADAGRRRVTEAFTQSSFVDALRAAPGYLTQSGEAGAQSSRQ
jgi:hypothetical protein